VFLNNVSLGAYADIVSQEGYRARKLATARVVLRASVRGERAPLAVAFRDGQGNRHDGVLVLLVANNRYQLERASELGARDRLDDGVLQLSSLQARTGAALAGIVLRTFAGRVVPGSTWAQWEGTALRVDTELERVPAGLDGELVDLVPPVEFRIRPRALRVLVPDRPAVGVRLPPPLSRSALRRLAAVVAGRDGA
jgi:diacylglycerol kinase family enzyme